MKRSNYSVIVPPAYSGVTFLFCWTYLMFYATSAGIEAAAPISLYSASYSISAICMLATLLILSFSPIDRSEFLTNTRTKIITGIALPIGTVLLIVFGQSPMLPLVVIGGIVTGTFSGIMLLQWIVAYKRVGLRVAASSFPMLMAMSVGICATLMYLPRAVMFVATIAFPFVSEIMFHEVRKQPWPHFEDEAADLPDRPINFVLMLLPFAVYAIASGFLDFSSDNNNYTFAFYAFGAFIPVIVSGVYMFLVERESFVMAFLIPLSFLIAVCVPFLTLSYLVPFSPFISIGELGIEVLIFIIPIGFAEFFSIDSLKTYALGRTVYVLFNAIGWYLAQFAYQAYGQFLHSQVSLVIIFIGVEVLAVCLIVAIVKAQKNMAGEPKPDVRRASELEGPNTSEALTTALEGDAGRIAEKASYSSSKPYANDAKTADEPKNVNTVPLGTDAGRNAQGSESKLDEDAVMPNISKVAEGASAPTEPDANAIATKICQEYGLSQRERDVFMLLARGYTSSRIQKELYIAAGTVNYHSRNIYAKLGVHSKQELIELFEEALQTDSTLLFETSAL